jgi:DNA-binding transcriptional LysR family regulator
MTLEDLRVLAEVSHHLSLGAAARALGCTQAAVGQHIRRLETELGTPLLIRGRRGSVLTPAGEYFAIAASDALGALARGARAVDELMRPGAGTLRIVTGGTTVRHFMGDAIAAFRATYPAVHIELHSAGSTRRCLAILQHDQADLAFITIDDSLDDIDALPALESGWTLVQATGPKPGRRTRISAAEIPAGHFISLHLTSVSGRQLDHQLSEAGVVLPTETRVDDWDTAVALVELQLGHALVPDLHATDLRSDRVSLTPITDLEPLRFGWATPDHRLLPGPATQFVHLFPATVSLKARGRTRMLEGHWERL